MKSRISAAADSSIAAAVGALLLAGIVAYSNSLRGAWVYDDLGAIVDNPTIRSWSTALLPPMQSGLPVSGRPLVNFSFALNYALGGESVTGYHVLNLAIHLAAALLLFGLVRRVLQLPVLAERFRSAATSLAFAAALLWEVHPLQTAAVTYISQRAESLMGLLFLLTVYAFVRMITSARPARWQWLGIAACAAGMAAKEVMVAAPVLVLLFDRTFVSRSFAEAWRQRRGYYLALAGTWLVLGIAVATAGARGGTAGFTGATTWWGYIGLQARAVRLYLKLAFWPHPLVFDYGVDGVPLGGLLWMHLMLVVALAGATVYALVRRAGAGLCGAWFFAILAPSSSVVPVLTETVAEHRMYLPLAAVIVLGVVGMYAVWQRGSRWVLLAVAAAFVGITWQRNNDYRTGRQLWADTVAKVPANSRAHYNLAQLRFEAGEVVPAIHEYEIAVALRPVFPSAHSNLANALVQTGDLPHARREVDTALRQNPDLAEAHGVLGNIELLTGRTTEALAEHATAVRLQPNNPDLRNNLGTALSRAGRLADAVREYEAALQLRPDSALLHFNLANSCARMGRFADAMAHYERTLALQPGYPRARENLARVRALAGTPPTPTSP